MSATAPAFVPERDAARSASDPVPTALRALFDKIIAADLDAVQIASVGLHVGHLLRCRGEQVEWADRMQAMLAQASAAEGPEFPKSRAEYVRRDAPGPARTTIGPEVTP